MKKNYLFYLLFAFFPLFLFAQEKGIGMNFNIEPKYIFVKSSDTTFRSEVKGTSFSPILYFFKKKDEFGHTNELSFNVRNFYRGFEKEVYMADYFRSLAYKKEYPSELIRHLYNMNTTRFTSSVGYTHFLNIKKWQDLEFLVGLRTGFLFDYRNYSAATSISGSVQNIYSVFEFTAIPTLTYKLNTKIAFDFRWNPPIKFFSGLSYAYQDNPQLPTVHQRRLVPVFDIKIYLFEPSFQIGAKYILSTEAEDKKTGKKKSKAKKKKKK